MDLLELQAAAGGEEATDSAVAQEDPTSTNLTLERAASETSTNGPLLETPKLTETPGQHQKQTQGIEEVPKDDDDTVSIMEIGYPALIEQIKARRCVELYMVYAEQHAAKQVQDRSKVDQQTRGNNGHLSGPLGHGVVLTSILSIIISSFL